MNERIASLADQYPAAAELLARHGGETLLTYLEQLRHRPLRPFSARRPPGNAWKSFAAAAACLPPTTIIPRLNT